MPDVFIATDGGSFFKPYLYSYNGNLYVLIPDQNNFFTATPIRMYKSTDAGNSWHALSSTLSTAAFFQVSGACSLIGTKLFIWYIPAGGSFTGLGYFDFTADSFTVVATSGNLGVFAAPFIAGSVASQIFTANLDASNGGLAVGQYVSNAFSLIARLGPNSPYTAAAPEVVFLGASGILHVFYSASVGTSSDLGYLNVVSGVASGTVGSNILYAHYFNSGTQAGVTGQPVQIGGSILFSFYDPAAQQLKLITFADVSSPSFAVSVIDAALAIVIPGGFLSEPTGAWTNILAYYGKTLYCFYTNTSTNGTGDGNLYYQSSADQGATWFGRKIATQHLDPVDGTAEAIWFPEAVQIVGTATLATAEFTYEQANPDVESQYQSARFAFGFPLAPVASPKNYVRS